MWHRVWWIAVGALSFVACGTSERRAAGSGDAGSPVGGTSGSAGTNSLTGGTPAGGTASATGGRGASATSGSGGSVSGAGGTSGRGGSNGGNGASGGGASGDGGTGDGGAGGEPMCAPGPVENDCSFASTCFLLSCGEPWSIYDAEGCERTRCTDTGSCPGGERCVPLPVLGMYDDPAFYEPESCSLSGGSCGCGFKEGAPLALCMSVDEFPPARDCTFEGMDCNALLAAVNTLEAYRDGTAFVLPYEPPAELAVMVEDCVRKLDDLIHSICLV